MKGAVLLLLIAGVAYSLVVGYHTEPRTAGQSGWTHRASPNWVSQIVTVNFDELDSAAGGCYVELFSGGGCTGQGYGLAVSTYPGGTPIAYTSNPSGVDHDWVRFYLNPSHPESIVRGKKLEFKFSRVDPDSLQFYYDTTAGYSRYGQMIAPSMPSLPATAALAMRVRARLNPVDSITWGATSIIPFWSGSDPDTMRGKWADSMESSGANWGTFYINWEFRGHNT